MIPTDACDFIVVGAGSAGCTLAARLSERLPDQVTLIEAGGRDSSPWIRIPLGYGLLFQDERVNWLYESAPEAELLNASLFQPRGRVLGGTGAINGMNYVRGQREDFDEWALIGGPGWSYDEVLPIFLRTEANSRGASSFHGADGPLAVSDPPRHPLADALIAAAIEAGFPANKDCNGPSQEGFGYNQVTVRRGRRSSTAEAYLHPAASRPNLRILTDAVVTRIEFDGLKATGVRYRMGGENHVIRARREIILCAGAFASPQLLQVSGVGPSALLQRLGVPIVLDRPAVGRNLQDHFTLSMVYKCRRPVTINDAYNSPLRRIAMAAQYFLTRRGLMATNASFCAGYVRSSPSVSRPDIKFNFSLWGRGGSARRKERMGLLPFSSFTVSMALLQPDSRGSVEAVSGEMDTRPEIRFNFLKSERDRQLSIKGLRLARHIMSMPAIAPYRGEEVSPGAGASSDDDLLSACRKLGRSNQHAAGSCAMGPDPRSAVVDHELRVHGVLGLRIADASIMPKVVSGNTNAAVVMIAEKASDLITADAGGG